MARTNKKSRKPSGPRPPRPLLALRKRARRRAMLHRVTLTTEAAWRLKSGNALWAEQKRAAR